MKTELKRVRDWTYHLAYLRVLDGTTCSYSEAPIKIQLHT